MWRSYLETVDIVLHATLQKEDWDRVRLLGPD
jgi:hypothetical protein